MRRHPDSGEQPRRRNQVDGLHRERPPQSPDLRNAERGSVSDLRLELAQEVADEIGAVLVPGRHHCGYPLMKFSNAPGTFCWSCLTDEQMAQKTRDLLERVQRLIQIKHIGNDIYIEERGAA